MRSCTSCRPCWPPGPAPALSADNPSTPRPERRPNEALLAAATGAWIVVWGRGRPPPAPAEGPPLGRRGHPPQVGVSGRGGRVSMAALVCYRPGCRARLFYRIRVHRRRRGERRSFSEDDYAALIAAAHAQLTAPIILVWDNLNV